LLVWDAGGDLRSSDGRRMMLKEPKSRAGMEAYFGLHEFISPEMHALTENQMGQAFFEGKTAVSVLAERVFFDTVINNSGLVPSKRISAWQC